MCLHRCSVGWLVLLPSAGPQRPACAHSLESDLSLTPRPEATFWLIDLQVTCGGLQSAHTAAIAAACAERGLRSHLLVRGERPAVPTGYHLLARMYGEVTYVTRSEYADRDAMLQRHAASIRAGLPAEAKVGHDNAYVS